MNKGDTVVYAQQILGYACPTLIEMTVDRDFIDKMSLSDGNRLHLVDADRVFPNMEMAVKALTMQAITRADVAESEAKIARRIANDWLHKLEDFD